MAFVLRVAALGAFLSAVVWLGACGGSGVSRDEFRAVGDRGLETKAQVIERFGEGMTIENLKGYEKRCLYYEPEDPAYDGQAWELCFDRDDEFTSRMSVSTEEGSLPGPALPVP